MATTLRCREQSTTLTTDTLPEFQRKYQFEYTNLAVQLNRTTGAAGGGGGYTTISSVVTAASQVTVHFASIPQTFTDLEIEVYGQDGAAGSNTDGGLTIKYNSDVGANYVSARSIARGNAMAVTNGAGGGPAGAGIATTSGTGGSGIDWFHVIARIPGYALNQFGHSLNSAGTCWSNNAANQHTLFEYSVVYNIVAPLTDIVLTFSSHATDGTIVLLRGIL